MCCANTKMRAQIILNELYACGLSITSCLFKIAHFIYFLCFVSIVSFPVNSLYNHTYDIIMIHDYHMTMKSISWTFWIDIVVHLGVKKKFVEMVIEQGKVMAGDKIIYHLFSNLVECTQEYYMVCTRDIYTPAVYNYCLLCYMHSQYAKGVNKTHSRTKT